MNDQNRFIWNVSSPYLRAQAETWGWPDTEIEEIRLDRDTAYERFVCGLGKAIEPATVPYTTTSLEWDLYEDLTYDVPHTLPFVCDQLLTYPRSTSVLVVAARAEFLTRLAEAWRGMGFTGSILVPSECDWLPLNLPGVEAGPHAELVAKADIFIFEFGLATQEPREPVRSGRGRDQSDSKRLRFISRLFRRTLSRETQTRPASRKHARRVVGVNVIYNANWPLFTDYVAANINPFSGQVLAGYPRIDRSFKTKLAELRNKLGLYRA